MSAEYQVVPAQDISTGKTVMVQTSIPVRRPPQCMSCDRDAVIDGWCLPCAAGEELHLTEDERGQMRDLMAGWFEGDYHLADRAWMELYKAGFDVMRRPIAGERPASAPPTEEEAP